jgi:superfamily I DNA/RNA helicase
VPAPLRISHRERFGYTELSEIPFLLYSGLRSHPDFDIDGLKLLIVDEYQDLNACDLACLEELKTRGTVIIAVGDDDQSIYGFRKAHPAGIRHFPEQYSALSYPLTVAQRFGKNILRWADYVINFDLSRDRGKPALIPKDDNLDGTVACLEFRGQAAERRGIVDIVDSLHRQGLPFEEILVVGPKNRLPIS